MSSERETIYVALLDEGIGVWRPVEARRIAPDTFLIVDQDYDPEVETWQFEPGSVVRCRKERRNGRRIPVATEVAPETGPTRDHGMSSERKIGGSSGKYGSASITKVSRTFASPDHVVRDDSGKVRSVSKDAGYAKKQADKLSGKKT